VKKPDATPSSDPSKPERKVPFVDSDTEEDKGYKGTQGRKEIKRPKTVRKYQEK
jgi:hypothetical protein